LSSGGAIIAGVAGGTVTGFFMLRQQRLAANQSVRDQLRERIDTVRHAVEELIAARNLWRSFIPIASSDPLADIVERRERDRVAAKEIAASLMVARKTFLDAMSRFAPFAPPRKIRDPMGRLAVNSLTLVVALELLSGGRENMRGNWGSTTRELVDLMIERIGEDHMILSIAIAPQPNASLLVAARYWKEVTADEAPAITSAATADATVGSPFSFQITATGFPHPKLSKVGDLPRGITFHARAGTFTGTIKTETNRRYPITITAKNSAGTATQNFVLAVL
jgi:hypothetical protein